MNYNIHKVLVTKNTENKKLFSAYTRAIFDCVVGKRHLSYGCFLKSPGFNPSYVFTFHLETETFCTVRICICVTPGK